MILYHILINLICPDIEEIEDNRILIEENNINTIYIGGGTPSSIKPELIRNILDKIYKIAKIEAQKI